MEQAVQIQCQPLHSGRFPEGFYHQDTVLLRTLHRPKQIQLQRIRQDKEFPARSGVIGQTEFDDYGELLQFRYAQQRRGMEMDQHPELAP